MSSSGSSAAQAMLIQTYTSYMQSSYCNLAARVFFILDYFITFDDEVHYFWGRKVTAASVLFLLNRYVNVAIAVLELFAQSSFQSAHTLLPFSCGPFTRVLQTLLLFALVIVAAFAALRVYAIWHHNWMLALPVFILAMMPVALNMAIDIEQTTQLAPYPFAGCALYLLIPANQYNRLLIAVRASTVAYDTLVFLLTLLRTIELKRHGSPDTGLTNLIMRDGCLYFMCLLLLNVTQIIVSSYYSGNNYLSYFIPPLTSILISRFLLNLRKVSQASEKGAQDVYPSLYLTSDAPSTHSNSDIFFAGLDGLLTEPSVFSDTLRSHGTQTGKSIELKSYRHRDALVPSIVSQISSGDAC